MFTPFRAGAKKCAQQFSTVVAKRASSTASHGAHEHGHRVVAPTDIKVCLSSRTEEEVHEMAHWVAYSVYFAPMVVLFTIYNIVGHDHGHGFDHYKLYAYKKVRSKRFPWDYKHGDAGMFESLSGKPTYPSDLYK
eukprot:TRINITY_DN50_c0_g1_i1.p2 TRINITY_DN50_c0_g1~~TRINITY_DN50_c0_g1_i1.p2  ORF type:complete len:135 (+),score=38.41 TRINITY_DN50_c0_g1_i1:134-538(+)